MDKIEVTQADRDAAAAVLHDNLGWYRAAPVRAGEMDNDSVVQAFARHRLATRTDATPVAEPRTIYVQFSDNGNIRKWAWTEFDLAEKLKVETAPVSDTPFAWAYQYTQKHPGQTKPGAMDIKRDRHKGPIASGWTETPLYTHPPATDVAALVEAAKASAEGWAIAVEFNLLPFEHWQTANDLQRQLRQALAPFTKGQNDE